MGAVIGVSMTPGATALTRMPSRDPLRGQVAGEGDQPGLGRPVAGDDGDGPEGGHRRHADRRWRRRPWRWPANQPRQPVVRRIGPARFRVRAAAKVSGSHSSLPPGKLAPALLTRTSSAPSVRRHQRVDRVRVGHLHLVVGESAEVGVVVAGRAPGAGDRHRGAGGGEGGGHGVPDPAGPPGDEDRRPGEVEAEPVLFIVPSSRSIDRVSQARSQKLALASSSRRVASRPPCAGPPCGRARRPGRCR